MKKSIFFFSTLFFFSLSLNAQNYQSAIGARLGYPLSVSYKHFVSEQSAFELFAGTQGSKSRYSSYNYRWYSAGAAYQIHRPLNVNFEGFENLNWYFGGGASVYIWTWDYDRSYNGDRYNSTSFGIQGYLGLDYTFENLPINITVDWVPSIFINGFGSGFGAGFGSVGIRYILGR